MHVNQLYVDGLGAIVGQGSLVRIDLNQISQLPKGDQKGQLEVFSRLVMNLETFLSMHESMTQVVEQMKAKGMILENKPKTAKPVKKTTTKK